MHDPVADGADLAAGQLGAIGKGDELSPGEQVCGAARTISSQAQLAVKLRQGLLAKPTALVWRRQSSMRAGWR